MEYATQHPQHGRRRAPQLTFRLRTYIALLGFLAFALLYVSVGIRWHTYRAHAALHAQREMDSTFKAAEYLRAARNPGTTDPIRVRELRRFAAMHTKAAEEATRLREFYEQAW